jgi:hypothetical protein
MVLSSGILNLRYISFTFKVKESGEMLKIILSDKRFAPNFFLTL